MTYSDHINTMEDLLIYIMIPDDICRQLLEPLKKVYKAAFDLGNSAHADLLRMDLCHWLRLSLEILLEHESNHTMHYVELLNNVASYFEISASLPIKSGFSISSGKSNNKLDITARHYGSLWGGFSPQKYFEEAAKLLRLRMTRNQVDTEWFKGKRALDCGCGGGRYTVALKKLGFREVIGVDWSKKALEMAQKRATEAGIRGVYYKKANVLELPFNDDEFDFVFSNGVLHHTNNTIGGIYELFRVMKPSGKGWLFLYARPGGLDRVGHYLSRLILKHADHEVCRRYCQAIGLEGSRTFFLLDLWLTPIAECYRIDEVEEMLKQSGCKKFRRLSRGADNDLVEQIYQRVPYASIKFGVGENRYYFEGKQS